MHIKVGIILVNYKDYAKNYLDDCIAGIRAQDFDGEIKIYIVDNASTTSSKEYLRNEVPEAFIVENLENDGFAKGNNDGMKLAINNGCDYVFLLNLDTLIEKECLRELVEVAEANKKIGAVQARLMLWPDKEKINSIGNTTHFLGFGYSLGYGEKFDGNESVKNIMYFSGAAVLLRKNILSEVGLFDERFWMYNEDQDLGWRIWLSGYKCVLAPRALVYHKYEFSRSISKYYWMDRNRILAIFNNYHLWTLFLILPMLIVMEFGLVLFAIKAGSIKEKINVWKYFISIDNWKQIIKSRRKIQSKRKIKDKEIVDLIVGRIWYQEIDDLKLRLVNPIFSLYWQLAKKIITW